MRVKQDAVDEEIAKMVKQCWSYEPDERPTFSELVPRLTTMVESVKAEGSVADDFVDEHGNPLGKLCPPPPLFFLFNCYM